MADKIVNLYEDPSTQTPIPVRFVDQGDGTWALKGSAGGGTETTKEVRAGTSVQSSVNVLLVSLSILAANANRLGATIYNEGPSACLTKLGVTASATSYSISIASGGYYEVPFSYTGAIDGICAANNAQLRVTEVSL